jgi:hypothetical protein
METRQGGYAHILKLKGYFYTNLGGTLCHVPPRLHGDRRE